MACDFCLVISRCCPLVPYGELPCLKDHCSFPLTVKKLGQTKTIEFWPNSAFELPQWQDCVVPKGTLINDKNIYHKSRHTHFLNNGSHKMRWNRSATNNTCKYTQLQEIFRFSNMKKWISNWHELTLGRNKIVNQPRACLIIYLTSA